jgi:hypothetical protein
VIYTRYTAISDLQLKCNEGEQKILSYNQMNIKIAINKRLVFLFE